MACTPETLFPDARCFMYLNDRQLLAIWANLVCEWDGPVTGTVRITEEGETRITEEGETRIIE